MEQGLYSGISYENYDADPAIRQSILTGMSIAPAVAHWMLTSDLEEESTKALNFGKAVHYALLEKEKFDALVVVAPDIDRRTKAGKDAWYEFIKVNSGKTIVSKEEHESCLAIRESVLKLKTAAKLIVGAVTEISLFWTDRETGVACKGRMDGYREDLGLVLELKTTQSATRSSFEKSIWQYNYARQAAWYLAGLRALGKPAKHVLFIAAEKEPPYLVGLYRLKDEVIELATQQNAESLKAFKCCTDLNRWPGLDDMIVDIGLPEWAVKKMEK